MAAVAVSVRSAEVAPAVAVAAASVAAAVVDVVESAAATAVAGSSRPPRVRPPSSSRRLRRLRRPARVRGAELPMLIPRRVKHRKQHHPKRRGMAKGGTKVVFGEFGIQAVEGAYVTNRQIEAARIAMTRHIKRGGKVWINIYPDRPLTKKPAETRMGSGKGSPEWWVANVKPGRVMFELAGVPEPLAREALRRAMHKLPMKCKFVKREVGEA